MGRSLMLCSGDVKAARACIDSVLNADAHRATKFMALDKVVRATRTFHKGNPPRRDENVHITITIGRPNNAERKFIKLCKKAGEPFPVRKIRLGYSRKQRSGAARGPFMLTKTALAKAGKSK